MGDGRNSDDVGMGGGGTLVTEEYNQSVTSPSTAVVEALAAVKDVTPVGLSTSENITLQNDVDPDARDQLLTDENVNDVSITFPVTEYRVRIGNEITVADRATNSTGPSETDR